MVWRHSPAKDVGYHGLGGPPDGTASGRRLASVIGAVSGYGGGHGRHCYGQGSFGRFLQLDETAGVNHLDDGLLL